MSDKCYNNYIILFQAFITNNFSFSEGAKTKALQGDYFLQNNTQDVLQIPKKHEYTRSGFVLRQPWITEDDKIRFSIPFLWDLSSVPYIAPGNELKFIFERNRFNVPLLARQENGQKQLKIKFRDAKLRMRRFTLNEPSPLVLESYFMKKQYYPINRTQMKIRTLPQGSTNIIVTQVINGQFPWHIFFVLLKKEQQNDLDKDPFSYETHDLRDFTLLKNGFSVLSQPLVVDNNSTDSEGRITTYKHFGVSYQLQYFNLHHHFFRKIWDLHTNITISDRA